ncbi:MAG: Rrf2 family transcriptional regulator, partial [Rhizobiales bacterium]|nr:Rrf2 family transcriptional regulator [Hyphomicrobiales bacterium]
MRSDNRLSRMLHVLLHMSEQDAPVTSDKIAKILGTNPVVVRRMMAGLRVKEYVVSTKGAGGGWTLNCA